MLFLPGSLYQVTCTPSAPTSAALYLSTVYILHGILKVDVRAGHFRALNQNRPCKLVHLSSLRKGSSSCRPSAFYFNLVRAVGYEL
jgi:hypothetical protein